MKKLNTYCSIGCLSVVLSILSSCSTSRQEFDISYKLIPVDARWDKTPEPLMEQIVDKYKTSVDSIMSIVIGKSSQYMAPGRPETSLTNLSADIIKTEVQRDFGQPIDFAIINTGGIRNPLMQGDITLGEIYSIFPFDNTLCLIKLKGSDVRELLNIVASRNGEAVSKDVHMTIADEKAIEPTINGRPIDDHRIYSIATIDYVANGGDHMTPFLNAIERKNSNTFMRDAVINFIERENREGHTIAPPKGGRIISSNNK